VVKERGKRKGGGGKIQENDNKRGGKMRFGGATGSILTARTPNCKTRKKTGKMESARGKSMYPCSIGAPMLKKNPRKKEM